MTVTLHWWVLPLVLFIAAPFVAKLVDKSSGWAIDPVPFMVVAGSWMLALGLVLGHVFG
jgi:hypothetical protein